MRRAGLKLKHRRHAPNTHPLGRGITAPKNRFLARSQRPILSRGAEYQEEVLPFPIRSQATLQHLFPTLALVPAVVSIEIKLLVHRFPSLNRLSDHGIAPSEFDTITKETKTV